MSTKNNHRPPPARTHKPRSKLIPSSATKSTRLAAADPSLTTEAGHPHLANSATAPSSPVHQCPSVSTSGLNSPHPARLHNPFPIWAAPNSCCSTTACSDSHTKEKIAQSQWMWADRHSALGPFGSFFRVFFEKRLGTKLASFVNAVKRPMDWVTTK